MAKPKSILKRIEVDEAKKAHNCQHNANHRVVRGEKRLKVWKDRSFEHYCTDCAVKMIQRDMVALVEIAAQLKQQPQPVEAAQAEAPAVEPAPTLFSSLT